MKCSPAVLLHNAQMNSGGYITESGWPLFYKKNVFLFFGFIRRYKGLDRAIQAFAKVRAQRDDVSFVIAGESFWNTLDQNKWSTRWKQWIFGWAKKLLLNKKDDEREDQPLEWISKLGLEQDCYVVNRFIGNEEVHKYFQVSNAAVLFYRTATPSGIESLSYNFCLPLLATRVGHFPETIQDGYFGININTKTGDSDTVGGASAGCQVFRYEREFDRMMFLCRKQISERGFNTFTYTLLEE